MSLYRTHGNLEKCLPHRTRSAKAAVVLTEMESDMGLQGLSPEMLGASVVQTEECKALLVASHRHKRSCHLSCPRTHIPTRPPPLKVPQRRKALKRQESDDVPHMALTRPVSVATPGPLTSPRATCRERLAEGETSHRR